MALYKFSCGPPGNNESHYVRNKGFFLDYAAHLTIFILKVAHCTKKFAYP